MYAECAENSKMAGEHGGGFYSSYVTIYVQLFGNTKPKQVVEIKTKNV